MYFGGCYSEAVALATESTDHEIHIGMNVVWGMFHYTYVVNQDKQNCCQIFNGGLANLGSPASKVAPGISDDAYLWNWNKSSPVQLMVCWLFQLTTFYRQHFKHIWLQ